MTGSHNRNPFRFTGNHNRKSYRKSKPEVKPEVITGSHNRKSKPEVARSQIGWTAHWLYAFISSGTKKQQQIQRLMNSCSCNHLSYWIFRQPPPPNLRGSIYRKHFQSAQLEHMSWWYRTGEPTCSKPPISAATEAATGLQHQLSSIDTIVIFGRPPKSQGGQLGKKYFGWHK